MKEQATKQKLRKKKLEEHKYIEDRNLYLYSNVSRPRDIPLAGKLFLKEENWKLPSLITKNNEENITIFDDDKFTVSDAS